MGNPNLELLWNWFAEKIESKEFIISRIAFDEVKNKTTGEFYNWFKSITIYKEDFDDLYEAQKMKELLEIEEDNYGKGVGEKDLLIIAISKRLNAILVSEEKRQLKLPKHKPNYKIPAVCNLSEVAVKCINFTELLKLNP